MHRVVVPALLAALLLTGCVGADSRRAATTTSSDTTLPAATSPTVPASPAVPGEVTAEDLCRRAETDDVPAQVTDPELTEISGVAPSRTHTGVLWVHEDSGSPATLVALGVDGAVLARLRVPEVPAVDWEDVALGRGPDPAVEWLFVGDIGDNTAQLGGDPGEGVDTPTRDSPPAVIRVPEPDPFRGDDDTDTATVVSFTYADGPRDAEALLADPITGELVVVSKQWDGSVAGAYVLPAEVALEVEPPATALVLPRSADVGGTRGAPVTAGDVSPDGRLVALRTYTDVLLWDRDPDESVAATLAGEPACQRPVAEPQGEAVGFAPDGRGFVTISEGLNQPILWHRLLG